MRAPGRCESRPEEYLNGTTHPAASLLQLTHMLRITAVFLAAIVVVTSSCRQQASGTSRADTLATTIFDRLPTGVHLDPAKPLVEVGPMALAMRVAPERDRVVISLSGYAKQGLQVLDANT